MQFKIVSENTQKIVDLYQLSRNINFDSEILLFDKKEVSLGLLSHKSIVYIALNFVDFAIKTYSDIYPKEAISCVNLARKWLSDKNSISKEEIKTVVSFSISNSNISNRSSSNINYAAIYACYTTYHSQAVSYAIDVANSVASAAFNKDEEFIRQGEFILDYLKSGLYLFHLEK